MTPPTGDHRGSAEILQSEICEETSLLSAGGQHQLHADHLRGRPGDLHTDRHRLGGQEVQEEMSRD